MVVNNDNRVCFEEMAHPWYGESLKNKRFSGSINKDCYFSVSWPIFFNSVPALYIVHIFRNIDGTVEFYVLTRFAKELF